MQTAKYDTVDLFKFIGSIFIFLMHLNMFGDSSTLRFSWELLARWAVPFFFIVSSFFLFSKEVDNIIDKQTLNKYLKRLFILYLAWFIFNFPSVVYLRLIRPGISQSDTWVSFIKGALLSSTFAGSWYLLSSAFSAVLLYLLSKRFSTRTCILISAVPLILCMLSSAYGGLLPESVSRVLRWLNFPLNIFGGVFYFSLGKLLFEKRETFLKAPLWAFILLAIVSFDLYSLEIKSTIRLKINQSSDFAFALLPLAVSIALFCLKAKSQIPNSDSLRKMSTIIYCAQGNVLCAVSFIGKYFGVSSFYYRGLIGIAIMAILVTLILYSQKYKKPAFVKYLT